MSGINNGWQTWLRFGAEANQGTLASTWHTYECSEADGLTPGETPIDRNPVYGARGQQSNARRLGHQKPGGKLPAFPFAIDGSSFPLMRLLRAHFQGSALVAGEWTFSRKATQLDAVTGFASLSIQKSLGISAGTVSAEEYTGAVINDATLGWQTGGFWTFTPDNVMAMACGSTGTMAGAGTVGTSGLLQAPLLTTTFNGVAIYPTAWSISSSNNITPATAGNTRGYLGFSLGAFTTKLSLTVPRDDNFGSYFITPYATQAIGTFIAIGTVPAAYGTNFYAKATIYVQMDRANVAVKSGELLETITAQGVDDSSYSVMIGSLAATGL